MDAFGSNANVLDSVDAIRRLTPNGQYRAFKKLENGVIGALLLEFDEKDL